MKKESKLFLVSLFLVPCLIAFICSGAYAASVSLSWDAPVENEDYTPLTDLEGFIIYYGSSTGNYTNTIDAGNVISYQIGNLNDGQTYYFAVTAYDSSGNESIHSVERSISIPSASNADIAVHDSISPAGDLQMPFGNVTVGNSSQQTVAVTNAGNADLVIGSVAGNNPLSTPFTILNNYCSGQTISPSSSCTLTVRFAPTSTGSYNDSFNIPSNDPDENQVTVRVNGTGEAMPLADVSVSDSVAPGDDLQVPFGDVTEGLVTDHTVTIHNNGSANLVTGTIPSNNPLTTPFSILNNNCSGRTLSPSSSCTLTVRFAPTTTGSYNDAFDIPSNDPDENLITISISGSGLSSIVNNPPDEPEPVYPAHGQRGLGKKVGFKWKKSKDPDGDLVTYDLTVCQDQNMTDGCITEVNIASTGQNEIVYAGIGLFSPFGLLLILIIPLLSGIRNKNRTKLLAATIFLTAMVLISCGGGDIGSGGAVVTSESESGSVTADEISQELSGLNSATTYYWTITARDAHGGETSSEIRSFETE